MADVYLYNTLGRKKERFAPIDKKEVKIYSCGPTVYWYQHIGNLRTYVFSDILKRVLLYKGFNVKHLMNVTDVGHLTSDADTGEDKMEKSAKKEGKTAREIADFYFSVFKNDFKKLNIIEPNKWTKATEYIKEQIKLIQALEKKGYTYKTSDGIYFDTSNFENYGELALLKKEGLKAGKRISMGEKRSKTDFALWKFSRSEEKRQQEWESPWGIGYPGWHIECSAMGMKELGEHFDIHTGGTDHIPIHHTNEIAQSEAATGKKFVNYWVHGAFLLFKGEKVSKSKGGLYTISELEERGFDAMAFRYLCLTCHYRKQLDFTLENLKSAQNAYKRLKNIALELKDDGKLNENYLKEFEKAICEDLDMPAALAGLWKLARDEKAEGKVNTIKKMDEIFGLRLFEKDKTKITKEIKDLIDEREEARKNKDWKKADILRERIRKLGFLVDDTEDGARVRRKEPKDN